MLIYCPICDEEVEIKRNKICPGCGEEFKSRSKKVKLDEFEEEDEFTADPWGNEFDN